jgi:hypothetical protein
MHLFGRLGIFLALSFLLSFFRIGKTLLFPFQIFTTWLHECCHAGTALLIGGKSIQVTLAPDGSGLTHFKMSSGKIRQALVAASGYMGASLWGCALFALTLHSEKSASSFTPHAIAIVIISLITLSLIFWVRNLFGFLSLAIFALILFGLCEYSYAAYTGSFLLFLAIQTALNALFDIRTLFSLGSSSKTTSDAHTLQKIFYLPYWLWAFAWLAFSLWMMWLTLGYCKITL